MKAFRTILVCFISLVIALPMAGMAADYPSKVIKIVVPFNAGGETDIVARLLAKELEKLLDNTVVVQNIAGAAGMTGCQAIVTAAPDGYTLGVVPAAPLAMHPNMRLVPYAFDSFTYIGRVIKSPYMVLVNKKSPWNTMADMINDMKANPDKYFWGSSGVGSVPYFAGMDLFDQFGLKVKHVPFTDDAEALQAIAGDRVQVYTTTAGVLQKYDVKALAILDEQRSAFNPEVPSVKDAGKAVYISQWMPLVAPKGLSETVMETLKTSLQKVCSSESFKTSMTKMGLGIAYLPPEETLRFVASESARNEKNIKAMKR